MRFWSGLGWVFSLGVGPFANRPSQVVTSFLVALVVLVPYAPVAQWIERRFPVPKVGGSTPLGGTGHPSSD